MNNNIIYHFTSLEAFYNIVKTGSLWAFDIIKSNDPKEGKFALECLDTVLNKSRYADKVDLSGEQWVKFRRAFLELAGDFKYPVPDYWMFCTSFCQIKNENLIPLWQIYGDQGRGVAVCFDKEKLKKLSDVITIEPIQYLPNDEMEQKALEFVKQNCDNDEEKLHKALEEYYIKSFLFKREYFEFEGEYRLFAKSMNLSKNILCFDSIDDMVDFSFNHGRIKSYYKLPISTRNFECVSEVILGPSCPMSIKEMIIFLDKNGCGNVYVRKADNLIKCKE